MIVGVKSIVSSVEKKNIHVKTQLIKEKFMVEDKLYVLVCDFGHYGRHK